MSKQTPPDDALLTELIIPLGANDRCDRCGAQAYVRVKINSAELFFCGHHFAGSEEKLRAVATSIHDERLNLIEATTPAVV
jgi:hypothetical protein